jgi:type II secretory pathway pseudopilin PulG
MDLTAMFEAIIILVVAIVTGVLVPYIKSKTTAEQQTVLTALVKAAVTAAEQIYTGSGRGQEKKAYVISWLADRGITVDADKLDALVESEVYELKTS